MDVTAGNFREALALLRLFLPNASFVSIDLEFTGLGESRQSQLDTPQTRYSEARRDVDEYVPIQFGLAIFHRNEKGWQVLPFNFNLAPGAVYYPQSARYPFIDRKFALQGSTVTFLTKHGFNFDKCLRLGISWLTRNVENDFREHVEADIRRRRHEGAKQNDLDEEREKSIAKLSQGVLDFITEAESNLQKSSRQVTLLTLPPTVAERAASFRFIRNKYPRIVAKSIWTPEGTRMRLRLYETKEEAAAHREEDLLTTVDDIVSRATGFRYVVDLLSGARVPLLVHNGLIDVTKLYGTFVGPLPEALPDFKGEFRKAFPSVYDTRLLLEQLAVKDEAVHDAVLGKRMELSEVVATLRVLAKERGARTEFQTFIPTARVSDTGRLNKAHAVSQEGFTLQDQEKCDADRDRYGFGRYADGHFDHEAGSDALQTGFLFGLIAVLVESQSELKQELESMEGKILLTSCGGYQWVDFRAKDEDEVNRWFGKDVIIVSKQSSGEGRLEAISTIQTVLMGTPCESAKYEIKFAGPDAFLMTFHSDKSELLGETLVKMQANASEIGVDVRKYSTESLSHRNVILRKNKKRRFFTGHDG